MPKPQLAATSLTPGQALYVLDRLVRERRVNARDVARMASEMHQEIADLERRLAMLRPDRSSGGGAAGASRSTRRKSRPATAAVAASRRLQGEYMGLMRHITGRERARIKKIAAEKGREAAVKEMRTHLAR